VPHAHGSGIDALKIDQALERRPERGRIVIARFVDLGAKAGNRQRHTRRKKMRRSEQKHIERGCLVHPLMGKLVSQLHLVEGWNTKRRGAHRLPEFTQSLDALFGRIAGNERRIDGAD
jgi:hypothetical protein